MTSTRSVAVSGRKSLGTMTSTRSVPDLPVKIIDKFWNSRIPHVQPKGKSKSTRFARKMSTCTYMFFEVILVVKKKPGFFFKKKPWFFLVEKFADFGKSGAPVKEGGGPLAKNFFFWRAPPGRQKFTTGALNEPSSLAIPTFIFPLPHCIIVCS